MVEIDPLFLLLADDLRVKLSAVRHSLLVMYAVWLLWSAFMTDLLNSVLPALAAVQPAQTMPFGSIKSLAESNFTVFATEITEQFLLVR